MYHIADTGCRCGNREGCLRGTVTGKEVLREVERWLTGEREMAWRTRKLGSQLSPKPSPRRASWKNSSGLPSSVFEISRTRAAFRQSSQHSPSSSPIGTHSSERSYSAQGHSCAVDPSTELERMHGRERNVRGGRCVVSEQFSS